MKTVIAIDFPPRLNDSVKDLQTVLGKDKFSDLINQMNIWLLYRMESVVEILISDWIGINCDPEVAELVSEPIEVLFDDYYQIFIESSRSLLQKTNWDADRAPITDAIYLDGIMVIRF